MATKASFLVFIFLLAAGIVSCKGNQPAAATTDSVLMGPASPDCDRIFLEGFANRYLDALAARDPSRVALAKNVKFTENGQEPAAGDALWATAIDPPTTYRIYFTDPWTGQVGFNGLIKA